MSIVAVERICAHIALEVYAWISDVVTRRQMSGQTLETRTLPEPTPATFDIIAAQCKHYSYRSMSSTIPRYVT